MMANGKPACDGEQGCATTVQYLDDRGFIYCSRHAGNVRYWPGRKCRKLRQHELNRLQRGETIKRY